MAESLARYLELLAQLRRGFVDGHYRPHKPALILAIISLIESGKADGNRITYGPNLVDLFRRYFDAVKSRDDAPNIMNPFWRLRTDGFFRHQARPGYESAVNAQGNTPTLAQLDEMVEFSELDDDLYSLISDPSARRLLRDHIISTYFPERAAELWRLVDEDQKSAEYENYLQDTVSDKPQGLPEPDAPESIRDTAFARVVREAYDYRCAACGLRVLVDDLVLVEAAHIIPVSVSRDNDPRNGIALCRNHHWAMDSSLLVPCPDLKWHAHPGLDRRVSDHASLVQLHGQDILLPRKARYHPKVEALAWRENRLEELAAE